MKLRTWQTEALATATAALDRGDRSVIRAIMGAGKSVVVAELVDRALRADLHVVVTVPTQELVRQLAASISGWSGRVAGRWYADERDLWPATVVCQASIANYEAAHRAKYGEGVDRLWIADECHRTECDTVLAWDRPARRIGLSATPWRAEFTGSISSFETVCYEYGAERAYADGHVVKPTLAHPEAGDVDQVVAAWIKKQEGGGVVNARDIADAESFARRVGGIAVHSQSAYDAADARRVVRDGGIVVYVDMLAEGFDCPEILWMALRRPVGSRVRFAQEVGRGLRACAPLKKTTCRMLDVWDLWGSHSMNWRAALGEHDDVTVPALKLDMALEAASAWSRAPSPDDRMPPELLGPLRSWIRHERVQALFDGRISSADIGSRAWRSNPCSRKQLAYLDRLMRQIDPSSLDPAVVARIRAARAALVDCLSRDPADLDGAFRKGDASDLIDVVRGTKGRVEFK